LGHDKSNNLKKYKGDEMSIELIYYTLHAVKLNLMRKRLTLPAGSKIEDILPLVHAKGLAVWCDNNQGKELYRIINQKGH
jgi:hypothetical protein